ncbi:MAG TPA: glycosyltransferase [Candidatus Eisenbacteria bacterium]|nr:glycosyltransferase [Candidatus Eisenbacteria bacterium]
MRIFLAIPRSPNPTFASDLWKANLHDPLVAMGHDTVLWDGGTLALFDLDPADPATAPARARFGEAFLAAVEEANRAGRLDLVLTYVSASHLAPDVVARVRERIAPVANFFCNNVHQFHLIRALAPHFTTNLVPEAGALGSYRAVGAAVDFFPMAANPDVYRRLDVPLRYEATFAGQRYADRASQILALRRAGVGAHAFGQGWSEAGPGAAPARGTAEGGGLGRALALLRTGRNPLVAARDRIEWARLRADHPDALHPPARDDAYVRLFSESAISLGFLVLGDTHRTLRPLRQVRLREFEAPMAGGFYVTEHLDELSLHYEIGREIVTYRSRGELIDRCRYYLRHSEERERIRDAGHARARRDHTWVRRFEGLFAAMRGRGELAR